MDLESFRELTLLMRLVRGKQDLPAFYYELCDCDEPELSHPPKGISGKQLIAAAETSCLTCSVIREALTTVLGEPVDEEYNIVYKLKRDYGIKIRYMLKNEWDTQRKFQVFLDEGQDTLPNPLHLPWVKEIHEEPLSEDSLNRIGEIVKDCNQNHPRCWVTKLPALPTRVIAVGNAKTSPKVLCTHGERAEYLALSHCWGTEQNFVTTTATLSQRVQGITWTDLPKCYQDTIVLARLLGFAYVWIDSLCIIQDDREDWEREGMKMGTIYENASLTIVASLSSADKEGFLVPRTDHLGHSFTIKHPSIENGTVQLKVRTALKKHFRRDIGRIRDTWRANLSMPAASPEPLDFRAWCYQEKIVSRRLLSFCVKEIEWDCLSGTDCECGRRRRLFRTDGPDARNGSPRQIYQILKQNAISSRLNLRGGNSRDLSMAMVNLLRPNEGIAIPNTAEIASPKTERERNACLLWRTRLVPSYTQLRLTKEMDRLPALSAVARGLETLCGGEGYLAGMWLSDLALSLSWQAGAFGLNGPQPGRIPAQYRAPSWSWASIEGPIDACFDYKDDYESISKIQRVEYNLSGDDPFSNVIFTSAHALGHLIPATLRTEQAAPRYGQTWPVDYWCEIYDSTEKLYVYPDTPLEQTDATLHRVSLRPDEYQSKLDCSVQLLAILMARPRTMTGFEDTSSAPTVDFDADRWISFLVLTASDEQSSVFCRMGIIPRAESSRLSFQGDKWYERWPMKELTLI